MAVVQSEGALVAAHKPSGSILSGIELHNGEHADFATLYRTQPNVRLVNGFLARNIAQLGLHVFTTDATTDERARLDRRHPLSRLVRRPNPYVTRYAFVQAMVLDLGIYDLFIAMKLRNPQTGELRLFRLPPYMAKPMDGNWLAAEGWEIKGSKTKLELPAEQVFVLHGYNPTDSRVGLSPLESLRRILAEEAAAGEWREQLWRSGARMSGVIERPLEAPKWSDTARTRFRSDFQTLHSGVGLGAGATAILEEGMQWKEASFSSKDSEYLATRRLAREEVAAAYYVSPLFVGILDHANFSNVAEQHKHLYQDTLGPRLVEMEEEWERQVVPEFSDLDPDLTYLEFNLAEKLKGTFEEQAGVIQTMVGAPVLTRDEGRARLNLSALPGGAGAQIVTPLNVLIGGQASPTDSAPPPSGTASRGRRALKAAAELPAEVQGWHEKHLEVLTAFFERQQAAVLSRLGAGQTLEEAWDTARWDGELEADLFGLAAGMTADVAAPLAEQYGAEYDDGVALGYLRENARIAAENVNETTRTAALAAWTAAAPGFASRSKTADDELDEDDEELGPTEAVGAIFALALSSRLEQIAVSRVTTVANFARHEGARQAGVPSKVWRITSGNPREGHPSDGETVPLGASFSNGARWPGDSAAGIDQTAGCTCYIEFSTEEP